MTTLSRLSEVTTVDAFLADAKSLDGPPPVWIDGNWGGFYSAIWNIKDSLGLAVGSLQFRAEKAKRFNVSVSVIYRNRPVWRVDIDHAIHENPHNAWMMDLKPIIRAPHSHPWPLNRAHLTSQDQWTLPYARELPASIRRIDQALLALAQDINLTIEPEQRSFEGPRQGDLFS